MMMSSLKMKPAKDETEIATTSLPVFTGDSQGDQDDFCKIPTEHAYMSLDSFCTLRVPAGAVFLTADMLGERLSCINHLKQPNSDIHDS